MFLDLLCEEVSFITIKVIKYIFNKLNNKIKSELVNELET